MRCEHCDYLLFNLTQPVCPECGRSFNVECYEFEIGAVSFHCPHCDQQYFGNDRHGLPYPRAFECVSCGNQVSLSQMRVVPERDDAMGERIDRSPWDRRRRLGYVRAWWENVKMTLVQPSQFFRVHAGTSVKEAWLFAMTSMFVGMVPLMGFQLLGIAVMVSVAPGGGGGPPILAMAILYGSIALIGPIIGPFVGAAIQACTIHLGLLLLVPHRKRMVHTLRTAMYAMGPNALMAIPVCGSYVGGIWALVTLIIGIKEVHQTTGWRAAIAVLWPVVLLIGAYCLLFVVLIAGTVVM
ncbi:MAG: YIP1 family protein [Phycisphaerales bacterium]|nr:MAG: YIP1 family protein [Phycisphaerales bacterium]